MAKKKAASKPRVNWKGKYEEVKAELESTLEGLGAEKAKAEEALDELQREFDRLEDQYVWLKRAAKKVRR